MTLVRWQQQVGALRPNLSPAFLADTAVAVAAARRMARRLAQAWFQYARALDTGAQLGELEDDREGGTLNRLRQNFLDRLQDTAQLGHEDSGDTNEWVREFERLLREEGYDSDSTENRRNDTVRRRQLDRRIQEFLDSWGEDRQLEREEFQWRDDTDFEKVREWVERRLPEEAERETSERRERIRREEREGREVSDERMEREHESAGQRISGEVHESVADAARKLKEWATINDSRVRWVARGTSATPCAFCAMLASRAASPDVPQYNSVRSAMLTRNSAARPDQHMWDSGFRKVHPNCNCYPIIRWVDGPDVEIPELNKEFLEIWNETRNFKEFRKEIYRRNQRIRNESQED